MKRYIFIILASITLSSCAYKSTIITSKINDNNIDLTQRETSPKKNNDIFGNKINLEVLRRAYVNEPGLFHIFLTNDKTYLEARSERITKDSIYLNGTILYNEKQDTINFKLKYAHSMFVLDFSEVGDDNYLVQIQTTRNDSMPKKSSYIITKSANYIIQEGMLEILSGEMLSEDDPFKFIIVSDPNTDMPLKSMEWLRIIVTEAEEKRIDMECRQKYNKKCSKGYTYDTGWKVHWDGIVRMIYCICK